jgi:hypothetical protein
VLFRERELGVLKLSESISLEQVVADVICEGISRHVHTAPTRTSVYTCLSAISDLQGVLWY